MSNMPMADPMRDFPVAIYGHKNRTVMDSTGREINLTQAIVGHVDDSVRTAACTHSGSVVVDWALKRAGLTVLGNDSRRRSVLRFRTIVENNEVTAEENLLNDILGRRVRGGAFSRMYAQVLGAKNAGLFDRVAKGLGRIGDEMTRVIVMDSALHAFEQSLDIPHTHWRKDRSGLLKNSRVARMDLEPIMRKWLLVELPRFLFDNGRHHAASNLDAVAAAEHFSPDPDLLYCDPPYPGTGGADYHGDWALLEEFLTLFEGGRISRPGLHPIRRPKHRFERSSSCVNGIAQMLFRIPHAHQVIVSINDRSGIRPEQIALLMKTVGRSTEVHRYATAVPTTIPGANTDAFECLVIGRLPTRRTSVNPSPRKGYSENRRSMRSNDHEGSMAPTQEAERSSDERNEHRERR